MAFADIVDVLIVGAGPAGLTAALTLARQNHTAILFDSGKYRNGAAHKMHMIPTWDGRDPAKFREEARKEILEHYSTIQIKDAELIKAEKVNDSLFQVIDSEKNIYQGRKSFSPLDQEISIPIFPGMKMLGRSAY